MFSFNYIFQENGVANDNSVSEKLNGDSDHKTIEVSENLDYTFITNTNSLNLFFTFHQEIATSPEKLEKLAAANPPPSTEVVAAE